MRLTDSVSGVALALCLATPVAAQTLTSVGPYTAVTDRVAYPKPALPALGPAGSAIADPVFRSTIRRMTDGATRPGVPNRSYRTPSSPQQNAWSANGSYFYVVSTDGTAIPFAFDTTAGTARRIQPTSSGAGGMVLNFYIEPQFSYVKDSIIYGSLWSGNLHTIDQYDFSTGAYTRVLDLETIVSGLSGTYIGDIASSDGPTERILAMFGGTSQDQHHLVVVFDRANPSNRLIVDTWANTLNGAATPALNFSMHHASIDRSGRYVILYPTSADQTGPRQAPPSVAWDTQTGTFTEMPVSSLPGGHSSLGYGVYVNQDCCVSTTWDGTQWQFRSLSTPLVSRDVMPAVLQPQEIYVEDHSTWNNARPGSLMPFISGIFRYGTQNGAWRALDGEITAVETDVPGQNPTIWRFAHHRTDVSYDGDPTRVSFWYEPRPNVSHDGQWATFTSNWEKTLGTDPGGELGEGFRQDVFIVKLAAASSTPPPPPPPTVVPVAISTTTVPPGRATVAYSTWLQATGGSGTYTWSITGGALPAGLTLDGPSGRISGIPTTAGTYSVTIAAADAKNATNLATVTYSIAISAAVKITSPHTLSNARHRVFYSYQLTASNVQGTATWALVGGSLPPGMTLNASTGVISGTCNSTGTWSFSVQVTDASTSNSSSLGLRVR